MDWQATTAGALTGLVVGLTGVGGGALMTPMLLLFFGAAPLTAVGTDLWFAAITKLAITGLHQRRRLIDWAVVRRLWAGSLTAATVTLVILHVTPAAAPPFVTAAIGGAVCVTAIGLLAQRRLHAFSVRLDAGGAAIMREWQAAATVLAGAILGTIVTLTSVGAGALGAVCLLYLYPNRLPMPRLIATDVAHAIPLALFAAVGHLWLGSVDITLLRNLLIGSIPAALLGAAVSARLPHTWLRVALAVVLLVVGVKLLVGV
ncbi:MAG TPA: sulfite exporter TauE/SafE family protein [Vicinamibacterales bacterium]|nr:sulfite exporter TauE/SafE family protein [Vicinamibacterales bacterium]